MFWYCEGGGNMSLYPLFQTICQYWFFSPYGQKPVLDPPYIEAHHRVCTYNETKLITVKLPNCAPNVNPFYTYPKAIRCDCSVCLTSTTECETMWIFLLLQCNFLQCFWQNTSRCKLQQGWSGDSNVNQGRVYQFGSEIALFLTFMYKPVVNTYYQPAVLKVHLAKARVAKNLWTILTLTL